MHDTTITIDLGLDIATVGAWLPEDEEGPLGDPMMVTLDIPQAAVTPAAAHRLAHALTAAADWAASQ
jgi:hypothetical protein